MPVESDTSHPHSQQNTEGVVSISEEATTTSTAVVGQGVQEQDPVTTEQQQTLANGTHSKGVVSNGDQQGTSEAPKEIKKVRKMHKIPWEYLILPGPGGF